LLCRKCRKKIPEGRKVYKVFYILRNWEERGNFHEKCAIKRKKEVVNFRRSFALFVIIFIVAGGLVGFVFGERKGHFFGYY